MGRSDSILTTSTHCCHKMLVLPATKSYGTILNSRRLARRAKGRMPEVTQASSVLNHWIMKYIHVFHPADQPLAVHYVMDSHEHMSM